MSPDLFGRPGSYPACRSDACNCGDSPCPTPETCVDSEARWRPCDRVCLVLLVALAAYFVLIGG